MVEQTEQSAEQSNNVKQTQVDGKPLKNKSFVRKYWKGLLYLILVLTCVAFYFWKEYAVDHAKEEMMVQMEQMKTTFAVKYHQQDTFYIRMLAKPVSWIVREELLRGNGERVNQYIADLVKEKGFKDIMVADNLEKVIASTDKKFEGKHLNDFFAFNYLFLDKLMLIDDTAKGSIIVLAPIYGLNSKAGTLLFTYKPSVPSL